MSTSKCLTADQAAAPGNGILHTLSVGFAAFLTGARSIPLGDNGELLRELAARAVNSVDAAPRRPSSRALASHEPVTKR